MMLGPLTQSSPRSLGPSSKDSHMNNGNQTSHSSLLTFALIIYNLDLAAGHENTRGTLDNYFGISACSVKLLLPPGLTRHDIIGILETNHRGRLSQAVLTSLFS